MPSPQRASERGARRTLTRPAKTPLTGKMASEKNSDSQDEKTALVQGDPAQEDARGADLQLLRTCEQGASKMTLYHWTQSFNSQKVSVRASAPRRGRTAPLMMPVAFNCQILKVACALSLLKGYLRSRCCCR